MIGALFGGDVDRLFWQPLIDLVELFVALTGVMAWVGTAVGPLVRCVVETAMSTHRLLYREAFADHHAEVRDALVRADPLGLSLVAPEVLQECLAAFPVLLSVPGCPVAVVSRASPGPKQVLGPFRGLVCLWVCANGSGSVLFRLLAPEPLLGLGPFSDVGVMGAEVVPRVRELGLLTRPVAHIDHHWLCLLWRSQEAWPRAT